MKRDYHIHAQVITKPETSDEFIEQAIGKEFEEICISDHATMPPQAAGDRIPEERVQEYVETIQEKAARYRDRIVIKCGIEVDYHPKYEDYIGRLLEHDFDYVLCASHIHLPIYRYPLSSMTPNEVAALSMKNTLAGAKSGLFDIIAHLDMYRWLFSESERLHITELPYDLESVRNIVLELLEVMEVKGMLLEINSAGLIKRFDEQYPATEILQWASEYDIEYVYGSDAHLPQQVSSDYGKLSTAFPRMNCFADRRLS